MNVSQDVKYLVLYSVHNYTSMVKFLFTISKKPRKESVAKHGWLEAVRVGESSVSGLRGSPYSLPSTEITVHYEIKFH